MYDRKWRLRNRTTRWWIYGGKLLLQIMLLRVSSIQAYNHIKFSILSKIFLDYGTLKLDKDEIILSSNLDVELNLGNFMRIRSMRIWLKHPKIVSGKKSTVVLSLWCDQILICHVLGMFTLSSLHYIPFIRPLELSHLN